MRDLDSVATGTSIGLSGATLFGASVADWALILSIIYIALKIVFTIYDRFKEDKCERL